MADDLKPSVGQRLLWSFDVVKPFKHKQEDGTELDLQRVYQFILPYGSPFEETYAVLDEIRAGVQKIEVISKEQEAQKQADVNTDLPTEVDVEDTGVETSTN